MTTPGLPGTELAAAPRSFGDLRHDGARIFEENR